VREKGGRKREKREAPAIPKVKLLLNIASSKERQRG